jgi:endonuclease/exonuclease/phosphatase family metal-dependent hydrolase
VHLDHESQEARFKGTAQVLKFMESRQPALPYVLTGDFNAAEDNPAIVSIKAHALKPVDSWRTIHPAIPPEESGTFHTFTGTHGGGKIDYIFVPATTRLSGSEILHFHQNGTYPSDHFPVRATIQWSE